MKAYMEDHLRNKDRLMKEWEALCSYQAEPSTVSVAQSEANAKKNRIPDSVPCKSKVASFLLRLSFMNRTGKLLFLLIKVLRFDCFYK